jgi:hypothetical protein
MSIFIYLFIDIRSKDSKSLSNVVLHGLAMSLEDGVITKICEIIVWSVVSMALHK